MVAALPILLFLHSVTHIFIQQAYIMFWALYMYYVLET